MSGWKPQTGDYVESRWTFKPGKVVEHNDRFGWYKVRYLDGHTQEYSSNLREKDLGVRLLSKEEKADLFLSLENAGITDAWSD